MNDEETNDLTKDIDFLRDELKFLTQYQKQIENSLDQAKELNSLDEIESTVDRLLVESNLNQENMVSVE